MIFQCYCSCIVCTTSTCIHVYQSTYNSTTLTIPKIVVTPRHWIASSIRCKWTKLGIEILPIQVHVSKKSIIPLTSYRIRHKSRQIRLYQ